MRSLNLFLASVGSLFIGSSAQAYILIDDFTVGEYSKTFNGIGQDTHQELGLDTAHSAFGDRGTTFRVQSNPFHVPVTMDIGQGRATVFTPGGQNDGISSILSMELGLASPPVVDFSAETEFWMDIDVRKPNGRFADQWTVIVRDTNGGVGINDGWLFRPGGIRFKLGGFIGSVDWSNIRDFRFDQHFTSQGAPHPESYTVTKIYTVPEPGALLVAFVGLLAVRLRTAKRTG